MSIYDQLKPPQGFIDHWAMKNRGVYQHVTREQVRHCTHLRQGLGVKLTRNGVRQMHMHCLDCGKQTSAQQGHRDLPAEVVDSLPVYQDNRLWADGTKRPLNLWPCDHCQAEVADGETHHWAPRALFEDADQWPTAYLCKPCHRLWHKVVTPGMRKTTT